MTTSYKSLAIVICFTAPHGGKLMLSINIDFHPDKRAFNLSG